MSLDAVVPESLAGWRADRALALLAGLSRAEARALVESGAVTLDGRELARAADPLPAGSRLVARVPERPGPVAPDLGVAVRVAREGADYVVVDKAPGVVVHPGAGVREGTLVAGVLARHPAMLAARDALGEPDRPGVVHRLDKGTSGLLVVATTPRGYADLSAQVRARTMERTYLALVEGTVREDRGVVDAPIARSAREPTRMAVRAGGRAAVTRYEVLERVGPPAATLLRVGLDTGRTHQIRVHLASVGHPVVNDTRYGHHRDRALADGRPFLHAARLAFTDPATGERVVVESALPSDLADRLG